MVDNLELCSQKTQTFSETNTVFSAHKEKVLIKWVRNYHILFCTREMGQTVNEGLGSSKLV